MENRVYLSRDTFWCLSDKLQEYIESEAEQDSMFHGFWIDIDSSLYKNIASTVILSKPEQAQNHKAREYAKS